MTGKEICRAGGIESHLSILITEEFLFLEPASPEVCGNLREVKENTFWPQVLAGTAVANLILVYHCFLSLTFYSSDPTPSIHCVVAPLLTKQAKECHVTCPTT